MMYFMSNLIRHAIPSSADTNNGGEHYRIRDGRSHARHQGGDQSPEGRADRTLRGRGVRGLKPLPDLDESGENCEGSTNDNATTQQQDRVQWSEFDLR